MDLIQPSAGFFSAEEIRRIRHKLKPPAPAIGYSKTRGARGRSRSGSLRPPPHADSLILGGRRLVSFDDPEMSPVAGDPAMREHIGHRLRERRSALIIGGAIEWEHGFEILK
jgi:hypothetical protein